MGAGKKKDDAIVLGRLNVMPWEREPLTEIKPLRDSAALQSDLDDRGTVQSSADRTRKKTHSQ
jgi:hypothetical protein